MALQHPAFLKCLSVVDKASVGNNTVGKSVVDGMDRGSVDSMGKNRGVVNNWVGNGVDSVDRGSGNIAEVTYSGEPVYPPAPAGGYVAAAPVHAVHAVAHPVVHHAPVLAHAVHAAPVHAVHHGLAHGVVAHGG